MTEMMDRGGVQSFTLRFLDDELEHQYQVEEGADGSVGYRIITAATVVIWAAAAVLLPMGTDIKPELAIATGILMAIVGSICLLLSPWATTMNRQHGLAALLTSANGLVILALGAQTDFIRGYAVAAIMVLFLFGFISRTRFVYAGVRTVVIGCGFVVAVVAYTGTRSLLIDCFFFVIAALASLIGLRLIERNRRGSWHQRLVIEEQTNSLEIERAESERLLLNVLPVSVSRRLRAGEHMIADDFPSVSVMFADLVGFTPLAAKLPAGVVIAMLGELFTTFDDLVSERGLEKIKTIGDSYMAVGGLPEPLDDHAVRIVDLALAIIEATAASNHFAHLKVRVGIHSGPAAGGVIGTRKFAYDVWGTTVNIASRLEESGIEGRVHVSEATKALLGDAYELEPREPVEIRGIGFQPTFLVVDSGRSSNGYAN